MIVAALYVDARRGPYAALPDVEIWDEARDATRYDGPHPVVAHPFCGPWGRLRGQCRLQDPTHAWLGLMQVLEHGGVLEHPAGSLLWTREGRGLVLGRNGHLPDLPLPGEAPRPLGGRLVFTVEVDQCDWGHQARKRTWLLVCGLADPAQLPPVPPPGEPTRTVQSRLHAYSGRADRLPEMSKTRRHLTPPDFAEWLVEVARRTRRTP